MANLNLAQQAWDENNAERVQRLLEETATHPDRGFEWYYLQRQLHRELRTFRGHTAQVWAVAISPDGRRVVTGCEDQTAQVWDAASGEALYSLKGHRS